MRFEHRRPAVAALVLALVLGVFAAGCAGGERDAARPGGETSSTAKQQAAGEATGQEGTTRGTEATAGSGGETAAGGAEATLKMDGEPGTAFSGTCTVGDEETEVSGEVPRSFDFALEGRKLDCEIRKKGGGDLKVVFTSGNDRSVHQTNSPDATVRLTYSGNGASFSSSSSSSGGFVIQQSQQSSSSSSGSVSQQSSSSSSGSP